MVYCKLVTLQLEYFIGVSNILVGTVEPRLSESPLSERYFEF